MRDVYLWDLIIGNNKMDTKEKFKEEFEEIGIINTISFYFGTNIL